MGKKKKDKFKASPFDYMSGGRVRELGERYGVDASDYNINYDRNDGGTGRTYKGDRDDYDKAVAAAAMRDYDTRRTMEARYMSGDKDAKKYAKKGFKNVGQVVAANDLMKDWHKEAGNGGSFSSASDFAGMTQRAVQADRDKFIADNDAKYASKADLENLKPEEDPNKGFRDPGPEMTEESDKLKEAKERANRWNKSESGSTPVPYDADDEQDGAAVSPATTETSSDATSMLGAFKEKLKNERKFRRDY